MAFLSHLVNVVMDQNIESKNETEIVETSGKFSAGTEEGTRGEITATTIARLMGLATVSELKLIESKLDLVVSKITNFTARLEKISAILAQAPTGSDLERIDVQIGALRSLIRETFSNVAGQMVSGKNEEVSGKKSPIKITSNNPNENDKTPGVKE